MLSFLIRSLFQRYVMKDISILSCNVLIYHYVIYRMGTDNGYDSILVNV